MQKLISLLFTLVFFALAWMTYDNVYSDIAPVKALAETAACKVKDCRKHHGFTKISRSPFGIEVDYGWEEKSSESALSVMCHRESWVSGPMVCAPKGQAP